MFPDISVGIGGSTLPLSIKKFAGIKWNENMRNSSSVGFSFKSDLFLSWNWREKNLNWRFKNILSQYLRYERSTIAISRFYWNGSKISRIFNETESMTRNSISCCSSNGRSAHEDKSFGAQSRTSSMKLEFKFTSVLKRRNPWMAVKIRSDL